MFFNNGDKYIGNFKDEQMEGNGTYYFSNGDKYEGDISQNMEFGLMKIVQIGLKAKKKPLIIWIRKDLKTIKVFSYLL